VRTYTKSKNVWNECPTYCPCCKEQNSVPSFTHWIHSCSKFNKLRKKFIPFVDQLFINLSVTAVARGLNIPDDSEEDFKDNINFYVRTVSPSWWKYSTVIDILSINQGKRGPILGKFFGTSEERSSLPIPYFVGLAEFLTYVMPVVQSDFFTMIDGYTIRPTVVRSVDIEMIKAKKKF